MIISRGPSVEAAALNRYLSITIMVLIGMLPLSINAQTPVTDTYNASTTWTAPAGVTSVTVEAWGAGGGGAGDYNQGKGGGGGGAYASSVLTVVPGNNYTVTVGAGGDGGHDDAGGDIGEDGGDSVFGANQVRAAGGDAGDDDDGGTGGTVAASIGTVRFAGCDGGDGDTGGGNRAGGGGGGSATSAGDCDDGENANGNTSGDGGDGEGDGGNGGVNGGDGFAGSAPGGGGGGMGKGGGNGDDSGAGANGRISISYIQPPLQYYSRNDGVWTGTGRWSLVGCGGTSAGAAEPGPGDHATVCNGDIVQLDTSIGGTGLTSLTIQAGGELQMASSNTARTLTVAGDVTNAGELSIPASRNTTSVLNIGGNIINSGTFDLLTDADSRVNTSFTGGGSHTISGSGAMEFNNLAVSSDLVINKSAGTITQSGTLTVDGNLTIQSGTLNVNNTASTLGGNFTNNGTFTHTGGTFTFNGSTAQTLTGTSSGTTTFATLTLDNANGLFLGGNHNATVSTLLTLSNGRITTNANVLFVSYTTGNGAITGANASRFIVGNLRKAYTASATQTRTFEVGTETGGVRYAPVGVTLVVPAGGAGNLTVSSTAGDHPQIATSTLVGSQSINRYWTLTRDSVNITSSASNSISFTYVDPDDYDAGVDFNLFYASRYNAPTWTETEPSARTNTAVTITGTSITAASISGDYQIARLTSQLSCVLDSFTGVNGASPGAEWTTSSSSGSFGSPIIFGNRLRLTNNSGNVATLATLERLFPGAGNRIEMEFQHFAYGGTTRGADGIAVVLSNSAITPVAGGYGGSLGYAQYTGSISGFAGGWIGVGIDEYGNFSNPTESRVGGPGEVVQSVAVRGSGSGMTGYIYHRGTATLSPTVDGNGAASPPHKYRIIVDHSDGVHAYVSVERNTGSGYVQLIAPYDAKAESGQADVPPDWKLSITGSTGGSNNIHEIDNLMICATQIPVPVARYVMDETAWSGLANEVADSSSNNRHGVAVGGAHTAPSGPAIAGSPGTCRYGVFDGTNDYVQITGLSGLLNETASLAFWIKTTQTGNDLGYNAPGVTGVEQNGGANDIFWGWIDAGGHIGVSVGDNFDNNKSFTPINDGTWHHVVLTRDHMAGQYKIYIDGALDRSGTIATGTVTTTFSSIGRIEDTGGSPVYFNGQLDEVWIYDGVVSDSTVISIMNNTRACATMGPDHYAINHAGTGVTCQAEQITITAHDGADSSLDAGTAIIDLSTSTAKGEWSGIVAGTGILNNSGAGEASYEFPGGEDSVTLWFNYTNIASGNNESFYFDVSDGTASDTGNGNAEDQEMTFARTGFRFYNVDDNNTTIPTQIAGKPSNVAPLARTLALQAVRSSDENPAVCTAAFSNGDTVTIDLGAECQSPSSCAGRQVSVLNNSITTSLDTNNDNGVPGTSLYEPVNLLFGANAMATLVLSYADVGLMQLHARYNIPLENGSASGDYMLGASNSFVVRPFGLSLGNILNSGNGPNPGTDTPTGAVFTSAGTDFEVSVGAFVWEAADDNGSTCDLVVDAGCLPNDGVPDTDADLLNNNGGFPNSLVPNFQGTGAVNVTLAAVAPFEPNDGIGGVLGQLLDSTSGTAPVMTSASFAGGSSTISTVNYTEVGSMTLMASAADYLGSGQGIRGRSSNLSANPNGGAVGRFIPYDFNVALTTPPAFGTACNVFTYIGQPFGFSTPGKMTVTARAKGGATTQNYRGTFNRITASSLILPMPGLGFREGSPGMLGLDTGLLSVSGWGPAINDLGNGLTELIFDFAPGEFISFNRGAPVEPFNAEISLEINVVDEDDVFYGDGAGVNLNPARFGNTGAGQGIGFSNGKQQRWGRLALLNAFGSELLPLTLALQAEYYLNDATGFVPNGEDSCTVYQAADITVQDTNLSDALVTADVGILVPAGETMLAGGVYNPANPLLLSNASDSTLGPGAGKTGPMQLLLDLSVLTGSMQDWLQYDWDDLDNLGNGPYDGNPSARVSFGIYKGTEDMIYIREPWN